MPLATLSPMSKKAHKEHVESLTDDQMEHLLEEGALPRPHDVEESGARRKVKRMNKALYELELFRLQAELVEMQEWVRTTGARLVVIFEGRDAAGKGGTIQRISQYLNPRVARIVALPAPTERELSQWYFQRYVPHLPAAGEIALFDRSWYNRAGVERVMGFCSADEYRRFLHQAPIFERMLVEDGILLRKYWFSVSDEEQEARFRSRLDDPMRRWKLSPMDLESITRWEDYSRAKDDMFVHTDTLERALVRGGVRRQASRPGQRDPSPAEHDPLHPRRAGPPRAAAPSADDRLPAPAPQHPDVRPRPRRRPGAGRGGRREATPARGRALRGGLVRVGGAPGAPLQFRPTLRPLRGPRVG